jgi:hypothetical protein
MMSIIRLETDLRARSLRLLVSPSQPYALDGC